jgi:hypothetical protein
LSKGTRKRVFALGVIGAAVGAVAFAAPAQAGTDTCAIPWNGVSCTTSQVGSDPIGNYLDYRVCSPYGDPGVEYKIRDIHTNQVVKHDHASRCEEGRVNGLYGFYKLELRGNPFSIGTIRNSYG